MRYCYLLLLADAGAFASSTSSTGSSSSNTSSPTNKIKKSNKIKKTYKMNRVSNIENHDNNDDKDNSNVEIWDWVPPENKNISTIISKQQQRDNNMNTNYIIPRIEGVLLKPEEVQLYLSSQGADANYDCVHYDEDDNDMDHDSVDNDND